MNGCVTGTGLPVYTGTEMPLLAAPGCRYHSTYYVRTCLRMRAAHTRKRRKELDTGSGNGDNSHHAKKRYETDDDQRAPSSTARSRVDSGGCQGNGRSTLVPRAIRERQAIAEA